MWFLTKFPTNWLSYSEVKFSAVPYCDMYSIVASVSWCVSHRDFAGDTQHYYKRYQKMNTFMHLADAFIQSDLQYIQAIHLYC